MFYYTYNMLLIVNTPTAGIMIMNYHLLLVLYYLRDLLRPYLNVSYSAWNYTPTYNPVHMKRMLFNVSCTSYEILRLLPIFLYTIIFSLS